MQEDWEHQANIAKDQLKQQLEIAREQLEYDRNMRVVARLDEIKAQGAKGLAVLNAGAVVAMFAFVQAMASNPEFACFKNYAVYSISFFLAGAFLSSIVFAFQYRAIDKSFKISIESKWHLSTWIVIWISTALGFCGSITVVLGIVKAL